MSHSHSHSSGADGHKLGLAVGLTITFVACESFSGYLSNSLALMSDAAHNFSDALALIFSWYALRAAKRPASGLMTYGSHRIGILAALANASTLVIIAAAIVWEAVPRFANPEPQHGGTMIGVACAAILMNGLISFWLSAGAKNDLNIRSAYLHMLGDLISAVGVVVAGVFVLWTDNPIADPIASLLIGGFIFWSSWGIISESLNILLEAAPKHIGMADVEQVVRNVPGVIEVHDLHVWTVASGIVVCSCHIVVDEQSISSGQQITRAVDTVLHERFKIAHATIQIEVDVCKSNSTYCTLQAAHDPHHGHNH